jgi:hypothetical protein
MIVDIENVKKGDVVEFKSYSLRVDRVPARDERGVRLEGRSNKDGSPIVQKWFMFGTNVSVVRCEQPKIVLMALSRRDNDLNWVWFQQASLADKIEFEDHICKINHRLASQPGSPEWRFKEYVKEARS